VYPFLLLDSFCFGNYHYSVFDRRCNHHDSIADLLWCVLVNMDNEKEEKGYFVVEFRLPIAIADASSPEEASMMASKIIEKEYGFYPSAWYTRVFEYGDLEDGIGVISEYFANPAGTVFRRIDQNVEKHEEVIKRGD